MDRWTSQYHDKSDKKTALCVYTAKGTCAVSIGNCDIFILERTSVSGESETWNGRGLSPVRYSFWGYSKGHHSKEGG